MASKFSTQLEPGFYWYFEPGRNGTVVLVDSEGVQFAGNDEYYQVAGAGVPGLVELKGQFVGPLVEPKL